MTRGEKIRLARERAGLTLEELGKKCGTTKQTIYKYETGKVTNIPMDRLELIAENTGVSAASLMGWDKENQPTVSDGLPKSVIELLEVVATLSEEEAASLLAFLKANRKPK